eukprot:2296687-Prymnesium_polylepis.1
MCIRDSRWAAACMCGAADVCTLPPLPPAAAHRSRARRTCGRSTSKAPRTKVRACRTHNASEAPCAPHHALRRVAHRRDPSLLSATSVGSAAPRASARARLRARRRPSHPASTCIRTIGQRASLSRAAPRRRARHTRSRAQASSEASPARSRRRASTSPTRASIATRAARPSGPSTSSSARAAARSRRT